MEFAGIVLIATAASVELVAGVLLILHKISSNPHMPWAMLSGVVFAVGGLLLYLGA